MTEATPDRAEEARADPIDNVVPTRGYQLTPLVGLGGSAGAIPALQRFFEAMPPDSGQGFVVVMHLAPEHESTLAELLQRCTKMPVVRVSGHQRVEPDKVYVIPPRKAIKAVDGYLELADDSLTPRGRHVAVDLFFRTLADTYGPHAAAVVLSGADGDGAIGIKRIKERGGLTVAQDPEEAEHASMPRSAIATGMVDWVLPVAEIAPRLLKYFALEKSLKLPSEEGPAITRAVEGAAGVEEAALRDVLGLLRSRTGRDFSYYKRATVVRRIARRMQVNGVDDMPAYLACLRTRPGEAAALLQDLLISVTNFFRDADCFAALDEQLGDLFKGKGPNDTIRVWVAACATGEEAYSLAILLSERAREMDAPPMIQIFATDLDEMAIKTAREGSYPATIEADVSEERLRRYFVKEHQGYKVRRETREMILFAQHDLLKDSPFSRLDLVSCRNLLIYLGRDAQRRLFEIFHFSLLPHGRLFLGSSESAEDAAALFSVIDKKHRIYLQRPSRRVGLPVPVGPGTLALALEAQQHAAPAAVPGRAPGQPAAGAPAIKPPEGRGTSWGELHFKLLEAVAPPSVLVDGEHEIMHLSPSAGRFLQYGGGEPSRNLLKAVHPSLRIELRAALYQAAQSHESSDVLVAPVELGGESVGVEMRATPVKAAGADMFVVLFNARPVGAEAGQAAQPERAGADPVARHLDRELERLKAHLRDTVEQYEASTEELKASNEELQAMNEELRSATEELETSREELQSINEELTTVNHELKGKVDELGHANSDMQNLMDATEIATVFLDRELRITRYTPSAVTLFHLIASDLGRPLADLATRLDYPQLKEDAQRVLERLVPIEREVGLPDGKWFLSRLRPYRTLEDHIAGVVASFIDITERKQAEEVRLWLSAVVASSADAIKSFSIDQTLLSWNSGAERMFGYTALEAIGQPLSMLVVAGREKEQQELHAQVRAGKSVSNFETVRRRKDGSEIQVALSVSPIRDTHGKVIGGTAIARDITEQKRAAEQLRSSEERLRLVVENASEFAIFSTDLERRVTIWNSGAQRLLGYSGREVIGRSADVIFTDEDRDAHAPELEMATALTQGRASDDRMHQRKDGSRFWASGALMLMRDAQGQAVGFVKILRDQTAEREAQQALERSQAELLRALEQNEAARAELQAADVAKDRFLAVLSHELRNPLASIDSAAGLLQTQKLPASDRDAATRVVRRQAAAMKKLLDDLLDVSRLKLGRLQLSREKVALASVVDTALETTQPLLEAARHSLKVELPPHVIEIDGDPLRLGQVLSNLLSNAIKYTPPGGTIIIKGALEGERAILSVTDTGAGMDPAQIENMFEMFTQAQPVKDRTQGGLGIGLALVRNIVELHGGKVEATSAGPGKGSQFRVILPARRGADTTARVSEAPAAPDVPAITPPSPAARKRGLILIADDNVDAGWGIARLLEIAGFATTRASGGLEAVKETRRQKPDVGIIDIGMPDLNGHEVARQIRETEWGKHMVLIAATGWGQESDAREAIESGFDAHMTKPVDLRQLSAVVDDLLARKRQ
jgi:two-component system, chemotaxis family, CheB/CheR fusion protein